MADLDGQGTQPAAEAANAGQGTQPAADAANAATGKKYDDDEMASARRSWEKKSAREVERARSEWERQRLEELEADSFDDVKERLTLKKQEESESAKQLLDAKKSSRELAQKLKQLEQFKERADVQLAKHRQGALKAAIFEAAQKLNANARAVFGILVAERHVDIDNDGAITEMGADGEPVDINLEKEIQKLVSDDAGLLRPSGMQGSGSLPQNAGARPGNNTQSASAKIQQGVADFVLPHYAHLDRR